MTSARAAADCPVADLPGHAIRPLLTAGTLRPDRTSRQPPSAVAANPPCRPRHPSERGEAPRQSHPSSRERSAQAADSSTIHAEGAPGQPELVSSTRRAMDCLRAVDDSASSASVYSAPTTAGAVNHARVVPSGSAGKVPATTVWVEPGTCPLRVVLGGRVGAIPSGVLTEQAEAGIGVDDRVREGP